MSDFRENVEKLNVRGIVLSSVMTAFGLVVALVWKDTIIATVEYILPNTDDGTLQGMYISAIAVTVLVMVLAKFAINLNQRVEKEIEKFSPILMMMTMRKIIRLLLLQWLN